MPGIRATASALAAVCAVGLAACGNDSGTIPGANGDKMLAQLDDVEQAVAAGDCDTARSAAVGFNQLVNDLPGDVDPDVRNALIEGGGQLATLADDPDQCSPAVTGPSGPTEATDSTQTESAPPATDETTPEETTPPANEQNPPSNQGGGNTEGNGKGGGSSGGGDESSGGGIGSDG